MSVPAKLRACFSQALGIPEAEVTPTLAYNGIREWDSVAHMALVAELESSFDLVLDTDDILALSTVAEAVTILAKYGVSLEAA